MPQNRFQSILEFFHFNDNSQCDVDNPNRDKLFKFSAIVTYLVTKFKTVYSPDRVVFIDEELLFWKRQLDFKLNIPNKRSRFGIKMFLLCEVCRYLWNYFVYLGKETIISQEEQQIVKELEKSGAVVPKLMSKLYGNEHHQYLDNWYNSERLFARLEQNGTVACGTTMVNRLKVPLS